MADTRTWPALEIRSAAVDVTGDLGGRITAVLTDFAPIAIEDLVPPLLPPGGLWDPTAPPTPDPPPAPIAWRASFAEPVARAGAHAALEASGLDLSIVPVDLPDDDWVARSQAALTAVAAGRFVVAPPWDVPRAPADGAIVIVIEPSMGFGTGHHQTTRLCLAALSDVPVAGRTVLDIGTGSGVLALAASRLGARAVDGVDIDADAIAAAERSAALNALPSPVSFRAADVFAVPAPPSEVVLANLTGAMLIRAADALATMTTPGGLLIVSGFMTDERAAVEAALDGFDLVERRQEDEWWAAVLRRRAS